MAPSAPEPSLSVSLDARSTELAALVARDREPWALARACLAVARGEYPALDERANLAELERLAAAVRVQREEAGHPPWRALRNALAREAGFLGDLETYDHPDNSHLNRVLERRRGLPILLSVVWVEAGRAAGLATEGVGLPGHFLAQVGQGDEAMLVDPFAGGLPISRDDALRRGAAALGPGGRPDPQWLAPAGVRSVVTRVLNNLAGTHGRQGDSGRLARVLTDLLALHPTDAALLAQRGEALGRVGEVSQALADLNEALRVLPPGPAFDRAHRTARNLARLRVSAN